MPRGEIRRVAVAEVPAPMVLGTLITYLAIYAALIVAYIGVLTYLARKAAIGAPTGPKALQGRDAIVHVAAE